MQNLINKCKQLISLVAANRVVHHIKKYIRTGREMRLSAQIGDYEMDEVILDLGSEVNVDLAAHGEAQVKLFSYSVEVS